MVSKKQKLKILEIFCGTKSFSKVAEKQGHECFTVDLDIAFKPDLVADLSINYMQKYIKNMVGNFDMIWMSPPCTTFSMASGNTHWTADRKPKTQNAIDGLNLLLFCNDIAVECIILNKKFIIENPRARARWFLPVKWRDTAWYCQYGHTNAKPTDLWHNIKGLKLKTCHNGNKDCHHEPAPRGSKTGTQGIKGSMLRGVVPPQLCKEILEIVSHNV